MSDESPDSQVREYYERLTPSSESVDALFAMRDVVAESRRWKRIAIGAITAASVLAALCGFLLTRPTVDDASAVVDQSAGEDRPPPESTASSDVLVVDDTDADVAMDMADDRLRLVAYRRHRDRCDDCRVIGESFVALKQEFADRPIDFVQLDFSDRSQLDETRRRSLDLGVGDLLEEGEHTGWVLTNSAGDVLESLEASSSREALSAELSRRLN